MGSKVDRLSGALQHEYNMDNGDAIRLATYADSCGQNSCNGTGKYDGLKKQVANYLRTNLYMSASAADDYADSITAFMLSRLSNYEYEENKNKAFSDFLAAGGNNSLVDGLEQKFNLSRGLAAFILEKFSNLSPQGKNYAEGIVEAEIFQALCLYSQENDSWDLHQPDAYAISEYLVQFTPFGKAFADSTGAVAKPEEPAPPPTRTEKLRSDLQTLGFGSSRSADLAALTEREDAHRDGEKCQAKPTREGLKKLVRDYLVEAEVADAEKYAEVVTDFMLGKLNLYEVQDAAAECGSKGGDGKMVEELCLKYKVPVALASIADEKIRALPVGDLKDAGLVQNAFSAAVAEYEASVGEEWSAGHDEFAAIMKYLEARVMVRPESDAVMPGTVARIGDPSELDLESEKLQDMESERLGKPLDQLPENLRGRLLRRVEDAATQVRLFKQKYPMLNIEGGSAEEIRELAGKIAAIEEFNPLLPKYIRSLTYKLGEGEAWRYLLIGGFYRESDSSVNLNRYAGYVFDGFTLDGVFKLFGLEIFASSEEMAVHEATHSYHYGLREDRREARKAADYAIRTYLHKKYYNRNQQLNACERLADEDGREPPSAKRGVILEDRSALSSDPDIISGTYMDEIEKAVKQRSEGKPYDAKLLELYGQYEAASADFDSEWYRVNHEFLPDSMFPEVDAAGRDLESAQKEMNDFFAENYGVENGDAFHLSDSRYGGDRRIAVLRGTHLGLIGVRPDLKEQFDTLRTKLMDATRSYEEKLEEKMTTLAYTYPGFDSMPDMSLFWKKGVECAAGQRYGLAQPYGASNIEEAAATFVQYVFAHGDLPLRYDIGDKAESDRHNAMAVNYARVLVKYGFIRADHPVVAKYNLAG